MKRLGITGGMAMGKSTTTAFLRERRVPVIDTDDIARQLVAPGQPALQEILNRFGRDLLDNQGQLRRAALAERVFPNPARLRELESILHPPIRERWQAQIAGWQTGGAPLGAVVIPLLFETGSEPGFDFVLCLACSAATQHERLRARGWSNTQITQRLSRQWPVSKKIAKADFVIWTDVPTAVHRKQLDSILHHVLR